MTQGDNQTRTAPSDQSSDTPFFIVGVHRSGTTLLRYMLSSSPHIYIPPESDFIPRFFERRPEEDLEEQQISGILQTIFTRYRFVKEWKGDAPSAQTILHMMKSRTPAAFLEALYRTYAALYGASRWGDKTPIYTSYIPLLHRLFPQAQFLHIIRDGRDVALSTLDKWGRSEFHVDLYYAARIWVRRIRQARWAASYLGPELYHEVRYEDLVRDPEGELRAVCAFLRETYLHEMSTQQRYARRRISHGDFHASVRQPPNTARAGRWRREMPVADRRLYQHVAGALLDELGYSVMDLGEMSLLERGRLAALRGKYETLQAGRQLAQALGFVHPIYGKRVPHPADAGGN